MISQSMLAILRRILCRRAFYALNRKLHTLSLHGIGLLNYENETLTGQRWFLRRFAQIASQMKSPATIVDVGANVGDFSIKVRQLLPRSLIYAFEPHPRTFTRLKEAATNWDFHALEYGCSESRRITNIYDRADQSTTEHASLYQAVIKEIHKDPSTSCEIQLVSLDEFIAANQLTRIHLLKIDTEGHEYSVLRGAQETITQRRIDVVQFEFNEMNVISRTFFRDFVTVLPEYDFYRMLPDGLIQIDQSPARCELFGFQNIVAIRREVAGTYSFT